MGRLDQFFKNTGSYEHPRLRHWREIAKQVGAKPSVEIHRDFDGLSYGPSRLYVSFAGSPPIQEAEPWNSELDLELINDGWRARTATDEAVRLSLHLARQFSQAEVKHGDGYFNSVLMQFVADSDLSRDPEIARLLTLIHANRPKTDERSFHECSETISAVLKRIAALLVGPLQYSQEEAEVILSGAVAKYLDERFSISAGINLGLYERR